MSRWVSIGGICNKSDGVRRLTDAECHQLRELLTQVHLRLDTEVLPDVCQLAEPMDSGHVCVTFYKTSRTAAGELDQNALLDCKVKVGGLDKSEGKYLWQVFAEEEEQDEPEIG